MLIVIILYLVILALAIYMGQQLSVLSIIAGGLAVQLLLHKFILKPNPKIITEDLKIICNCHSPHPSRGRPYITFTPGINISVKNQQVSIDSIALKVEGKDIKRKRGTFKKDSLAPSTPSKRFKADFETNECDYFIDIWNNKKQFDYTLTIHWSCNTKKKIKIIPCVFEGNFLNVGTYKKEF